MYHLRNLINRTAVPSDPEKNMNAAEDTMLLLLYAHVVTAGKTIQSINQSETVQDLGNLIVSNNVRLPRIGDQPAKSCVDVVHLYATELLSLGLLWHAFHDATREGDGERILWLRKFLLEIFKSTNHRNYAKEAVNLHVLLQYKNIFAEREKAQLL